MKATAYRDLTYKVIIDREENEEWAPYNDRGADYQIDSVAVTVTVNDEGAFKAGWKPVIVRGWRIRSNGTPGRAMGRDSLYWAGTPETEEQEQKFKDEALRVARAAHLAER
jgi:hypothetical protein